MKAHKCPVCDGNGLIPAGFYEKTPNIFPITCRSCKGTGVLWEPETLSDYDPKRSAELRRFKASEWAKSEEETK